MRCEGGVDQILAGAADTPEEQVSKVVGISENFVVIKDEAGLVMTPATDSPNQAGCRQVPMMAASVYLGSPSRDFYWTATHFIPVLLGGVEKLWM